MAIDPDVELVLTKMQADIDELKARPVAKVVVKQVLYYGDDTFDTFDLSPP